MEGKGVHNTDTLLRDAEVRTCKVPLGFVSGALSPFFVEHEKGCAQKDAWQPYCARTRDMRWRDQLGSNNMRGRLNGTIRDREKVSRGPKKQDTAMSAEL